MSGCFKYRVHLDVAKDGSITGYNETLLKDSVLSIGGTDSDEAVQSMIDEQKKQYPDSQFTVLQEGEGEDLFKGYRMTNIPTKGYNVKVEKNTVTVTVELTDSQDELSDLISESGQQATVDQLKEQGVEATLSITMPQKIESANIGTIDGKTVTVDLFGDNGGAKDLVVVSKATDYLGLLVYAGIGVAALIAVFLILRSRGSKA
jgi:hypothetical protein